MQCPAHVYPSLILTSLVMRALPVHVYMMYEREGEGERERGRGGEREREGERERGRERIDPVTSTCTLPRAVPLTALI